MNVPVNAEVFACELHARRLHRGQVDKQGAPFIQHPAAVAAILEKQGAPWQSVAAAWLHDAVEDGKITMAELRVLVPAEVADLVDVLTRRKGSETYSEYILRVARTPAAVPIKLADLEHNLDESRGPATTEIRSLWARYATARSVLLSEQKAAAAEGRA